VDLMPDTNELVAASSANQRIKVIGNTRGRKVDPSDDPPDEIRMFSEFKELASLALA
jgi:hypothetical protein